MINNRKMIYILPYQVREENEMQAPEPGKDACLEK
jgi:hypothetical protein